jgi:hypothetical protein
VVKDFSDAAAGTAVVKNVAERGHLARFHRDVSLIVTRYGGHGGGAGGEAELYIGGHPKGPATIPGESSREKKR